MASRGFERELFSISESIKELDRESSSTSTTVTITKRSKTHTAPLKTQLQHCFTAVVVCDAFPVVFQGRKEEKEKRKEREERKEGVSSSEVKPVMFMFPNPNFFFNQGNPHIGH